MKIILKIRTKPSESDSITKALKLLKQSGAEVRILEKVGNVGKFRTYSVEKIQAKVSDYLGMTIQDMNSKTRKREFVEARQIAHYFAKQKTMASLQYIGWIIGGKDHATVLHSCKTVNDLIETDNNFREKITQISNYIG